MNILWNKAAGGTACSQVTPAFILNQGAIEGDLFGNCKVQLLENNFRAPGCVAVGADHGSVSSKLLLQINPVRGTVLTATCQFCEFAANSRITLSGLGSGVGSASKTAGQSRAQHQSQQGWKVNNLLRCNGSSPLLHKGFCCSGFCGIRCRITVVLLGVSLLPQSAKVIEIKMLVHIVLWLHKPPSPVFCSPWGGEGPT